jgi:hypothetical protein
MRLGLGNKLGSGNSIISNGLLISGFAYPNETLTAPAGTSYQWYVNDIARVTTQTMTPTVNDIGLVVRCVVDGVECEPVTMWHPNQIAAVKNFWWAESGAYNSLGNYYTDETAPFSVNRPDSNTLFRNGSVNGKAAYGNVGASDTDYCSWDSANSRWVLVVSSGYYGNEEPDDFVYHSTDNTTYPWQVTTWTVGLNAASQVATRETTTYDVLATDGQAVTAWRDIISGVNVTSSGSIAGLIESTDLDTQSIKFDSTDFFTIPISIRTVFNLQNYGYIFAGAKDTVPDGGDATHAVVSINRTGSFPKVALTTRYNGNNTFDAITGPNGTALAFGSSLSNNNSAYNVLTNEAMWADGEIRLRINGSQEGNDSFEAVQPNSTTTTSYIGAYTSNTNNFNGYMTAIILAAGDSPLSDTDRSRIERFIGLLDSGINIPLV